MVGKFLRKFFGGIRLALTILVLLFGSIIIITDVFFPFAVSGAAYGFLAGMLTQVIVYQALETKRKTI